MYCFENTSISLEARLCGCPVVQLKSKFTAGGELFSAGIGLAVGLISDDRPETLMQTRAQLPSLTHRYKEVEQEFWRSLASFIEQTQEASQVRPRRARRAAPDPFQIAYQEWQQRSAFGELDAQLYAERLMTCWSHRPGFHLLMSVQQNELDVLQKTIDSLTQQLYGEWLLTVVSSMPKPTILAQNESRLQWLTVKDDAHTQYVLSEMAAVSPGHWLALVAPGVICEPQCLLVVGDQVNEHPDWQLIYVDEDTMEEDGSLTQPLFKPDFNLDLLRSQSYVGSMVWVKKEALISAGGYGHCTGAENFDVCLRIADRHGGEGIGHIPQILAHLHRGSQRNWSELAEQTALETHCNRRQLDAKVLQGQLRCTWRVEPVWLSQPLVSLIVQSGVWGERLGPWLTALKQNTRYPALELVLIDQDPDNQDTASLSHAIATSDTWIGRVVRVRGSGTSETSLANQGTEAARGEYILFLNECVAAPKSEWLGTLMSRAQRTEAGIVVPSLTTTKGTQENIGPEIMGTSEIRPPASSTSSAHKAGGYMGRHFCDQNVNTVATAAVLVRKSVITSLGGLDMRYSTQKHALKDLCLRVVRAKLLIIWTPHAQLQLNADCLRTPLSSEAQEAFANSLKLEREDQQIFRTQWLNALAHDPAYNPNLSLVTPWLPDLSSVGRWPVHPMARPRLLGISFAPDGESFHALSSALTSVHGVGAAQTLMLSRSMMVGTRFVCGPTRKPATI